MDTPQNQGIDGLRRPEGHRDVRIDSARDNPAIEHISPNFQQSSVDRSLDALHPHHVSHPTLAISTAQRSADTLTRHIFIFPFVMRRTDRKIRRLMMVRVLTDWKLYVLFAFPLLAYFGRANQLSTREGMHEFLGNLHGSNLQILSVFLALVILASMLLRRIFDQVSFGIKLKTMDHRVADISKLLIHWLDSSLSNILLGFVSLVSIVLSSGVLFLLVRTILGNSNEFIVNFQAILLYICLVASVGVSFVIAMIRLWSRISYSVVNHGVATSIRYNGRLLFHNFFIALAYALFGVSVSAVAIGAVVAILWTQGTFLNAQPTELARLCVLVGGILSIYGVSYYYQVWAKSYWATVYYSLVHAKFKARSSEYLTVGRPTAHLIGKLAVILVGLLGLVGVLFWVIYMQPTWFEQLASRIHKISSFHYEHYIRWH